MVEGDGSSSLASYGEIHISNISIRYIPARIRILGISCHLFICTFHFI